LVESLTQIVQAVPRGTLVLVVTELITKVESKFGGGDA